MHPGENQQCGSDRDTVMTGNRVCGVPSIDQVTWHRGGTEICTSGSRRQSSRRHVPFRLRLFATSPLITTTVDAEKPFTCQYLRSVRFMVNRIAYHIVVDKARAVSLGRTTVIHLTSERLRRTRHQMDSTQARGYCIHDVQNVSVRSLRPLINRIGCL